ncbi:14334_t:CDS:2, partial [Funneliformis caledonium]
MSLSKATGRLTPSLLYTDADPAIIAAINSTWPTTKHHFCLFHIRKNLEKHFLSKYRGEKWNKFFAAFCYARNSQVESIFEERWAALLEAYVLCFTHRAFNAGIQSIQRIELYNSIIKNNVNGSSSLTELEHIIERLLAKKSKFIKLNETIGKLPVSQDEDYHNHYFKEVDISCQYFLTLAILKLQRHEMNHSMHYRCHLSNLKYELKQQVTVESPRGMFSEDMFNVCVIELALVCHHFFATMLVSSIAKFHIGLLPQRWYTNVSVMEADSTLSNVSAISLLSNNGFGTVEHA